MLFELLMKIGGDKMRYTSFLLCFILNGCWYSNGCFYTPQMVNCVDKGKLWPAIAHYQKPYSIGKTDQQQRWKDAVSCGSKYGDQELHYINKTGKYTISIKLVNTKNFNLVWKERDITDTGQLNVAIKILSGIRENVIYNELNIKYI